MQRAYSNESGQPRAVLASQSLRFTGSGSWVRLNFSLTPSAAAPCVPIAPGSDPAIRCKAENVSVGHVCVRCGGEFVVGLAAPAEVLVDFAVLQPGSWGRYKGLPVHRGTVDALLEMGVTAIRFGGSFVSYYVRTIAREESPPLSRTFAHREATTSGRIGVARRGCGPASVLTGSRTS